MEETTFWQQGYDLYESNPHGLQAWLNSHDIHPLDKIDFTDGYMEAALDQIFDNLKTQVKTIQDVEKQQELIQTLINITTLFIFVTGNR